MYGCESLGHLPIEETAEITVARHLGEAVDFLWGPCYSYDRHVACFACWSGGLGHREIGQHCDPVKRPLRTRVKCGAALKYRDIRPARPFPCPVRHTLLQAPWSYTQWTGWGSIALAALVLAALGLRGYHLLSAVLFASVPVLYLEVFVLKYLIPPRVETYLPKDSTLRLRD